MTIWSCVKENKKIIAVLSIFVLLSNAFKLFSPYLLQQIVDFKGKNINYIFFFIITLIASYLNQLLFEYYNKKFQVSFMTKESLKLSKLIYKMKYSAIEEYEPTYLVNRMEEAVNNLYRFISENVSDIISGLVSIVIIIACFFKYNVSLAILYILYALVSFLGYKILNRKLLEKSIVLQDIVSQNDKNILCFMTNVDFLKLSPDFKNIYTYLKKFFKRSTEENASVGFFAASVGIALDAILEIVQNIIYILTFYFAFCNKMSYSQVAAIVLLNSYFKSSMKVLNTTNIGMRDVKASLDYINNILMKNCEYSRGIIKINTIDTFRIDISNISFGENTLIESGTINGKKGEIIGIIGESGVGKSTLVKTILGLREIEGCRTYFNDIDASEIRSEIIKNKIGYISQNPSVFPVTVKENFLLEVYTEEDSKCEKEYQDLLSKKGFKKFRDIAQEMVVLEGAANMSGGDKQKIAIGRIILRLPDMLILDEFSNSIDAETEEYIMNFLKKTYEEKIIVLITHNRDLLKWCNRVYAIQGKKVEEISL